MRTPAKIGFVISLLGFAVGLTGYLLESDDTVLFGLLVCFVGGVTASDG